MSHDTDKLIRQLSLVAFLMAERRPLTARDIKGNVEGYQEMSDEAFARHEERERTINPYALLPENGTWYVIGEDQDDEVVKNFRVARIRSDIRYASRRERDFRMPRDFDIEEYRGRADWQFGEVVGE